jgi:hypothetical protein
MGGRNLAGAALASGALVLLAGCGDSPDPGGRLPAKLRMGSLHHAELLIQNRVPVRVRVRRSARVQLRAVVRTRGGRRLRLGSVRGMLIRRGRSRELSVPISPAGRTALAGCPGGRVEVTVSSGRFSRSASAPLVLDPPDCGRFFGEHAIWNDPLAADAPLDPASDQISSELRGQVAAAFGSHTPPSINTNAYTPPVYTVGAGTPTVPVHLDKPPGAAPGLEHALASVPMPPNATPAEGGDSELVVWQPATDTLWEFWQLHRAADGWHASWGGRLEHVSSGSGVFSGAHESWGATATSLPLVGGLITPRELREGEIDHALAMAVPEPRAGAFSRPARRSDGSSPCPNSVPEGARFRLDPSLDLDALGLPGPVKAMARAAQRYGIYVRDKSSTFVFYAQNPLTLGFDPYPALFGGMAPWDLLRSFPWDHLQLLRMDLVKTGGQSPTLSPDQVLRACR